MTRGTTSPEHENLIAELSIKYGLKPVKIIGNQNITGQYFADLVNNTTDFEIEVVPRSSYIKKKSVRWDSGRKKVLVLKPNSVAWSLFDEIYVIDCNGKLISLSKSAKLLSKEYNL